MTQPTDGLNLSDELSAAFRFACLSELEALKPGNVHIFADGHGMKVQDFVNSAEAAAIPITHDGLSVGERIESAVKATWDAVGCNTNLGIVLLSAPLIHAVFNHTGSLKQRLQTTLDDLTVADANLAFKAILRASPAGLGDASQHDVHQPAAVTLLEAMREASGRDLIACQYVTAYADIFEFGVPRYQECLERWERPAWAASALYMGFLARYDDTHLLRKHGQAVASEVRAEASVLEAALVAGENPKNRMPELLQFDRSLKARGLNPGTCADLTVASLLVVLLEKLCNHGNLFRAKALTATQAAKTGSGESKAR